MSYELMPFRADLQEEDYINTNLDSAIRATQNDIAQVEDCMF